MRTLTSLETKTEVGGKIYIDKKTGQQWERYAYDGIEYLRISFYGLRVYPYMATEETINLIIKSTFLDEISGASKLLFYLEYSRLKFREKLINSLEENLKSISKEKLDIIYLNANLGNKSNLKGIINKSIKIMKIY